VEGLRSVETERPDQGLLSGGVEIAQRLRVARLADVPDDQMPADGPIAAWQHGPHSPPSLDQPVGEEVLPAQRPWRAAVCAASRHRIGPLAANSQPEERSV